MFALRWLRVAVSSIVLAYLLAIATMGPIALIMGSMGMTPRMYSALIAVGPVALAVCTMLAVRRLTLLASRNMDTPPDDQVERIGAACRMASLPIPTCWVTVDGNERPVTLRGLRRLHVLGSEEQLARPELVVDALRRDLRSGDGWLLPMFSTIASAHHMWADTMELVTIGVRDRSVSAFGRLRGIPLLFAVPVVATGWCSSWLACQVARAMVPRRFVTTMLVWFGTTTDPRPQTVGSIAKLGRTRSHHRHLSTALAGATTDHAPRENLGPARSRSWWSTPQALYPGVGWDPLSATATVIAYSLIVWAIAFQGYGDFLAQRQVWPGERSVAATITEVQADIKGQDGLLAKLGVDDTANTYDALAVTSEGVEVDLARGTTPVAVDDVVTVIVNEDEYADAVKSYGTHYIPGRSQTQDSLADILMMGTSFLMLGLGSLRGTMGLYGMVGGAMAQKDYDQRVATGRRHKRRRPRSLFAELSGEAEPRDSP